jgi:hypothetical protein
MEYNAVLEVSQVESTPTEPVTLAEAKAWCKIELDITEEDGLITELITVARELVEGYLNISLVDKTITAHVRNDLGNIEFPYGPVKAITSVKDADDVTLVADSTYTIQGINFLCLTTPCDELVKLEYTTGWTAVPEYFKTAVKNQILFLYENRGDSTLSPMLKTTLKPYRRVW